MKHLLIALMTLIMTSCCTLGFESFCEETEINSQQQIENNDKIRETVDKSTRESQKIDENVKEASKKLPKKELNVVQNNFNNITKSTEEIRRLNGIVARITKENKKFIKESEEIAKERDKYKEDRDEYKEKLDKMAEDKLIMGFAFAGGLSIICIGLGVYSAKPRLIIAGVVMTIASAGATFYFDNIQTVGAVCLGLGFVYVAWFIWDKRKDDRDKDAKLEEEHQSLKESVNMIEHLKTLIPEEEKKEFFKKEHRAVHMTSDIGKKRIAEVKKELRS